MTGTSPSAQPSRRTLLALVTAAAAGGSVAGCSGGGQPAPSGATGAGTATTPAGPRPPSSPSSSAPAASSTPAASPPSGPDITHGPRNLPAVALTFHGDGPAALVRQTLAVLSTAKAHVTVLAIGRWLAAEPDLARMIRDGGHELGNHTWSHQTLPRLQAGAVTDEVDRAATELQKLTGSPGRWFRPSGTPHSTPLIRAAAVAAGYGACLGYDVDPLDYTDPGPDAVARSLARAVRPGSIVSLHLGHPGTVAALPAVVAHLHDQGLTSVTASELLGARANG